ncbi:hypothetical protein A6R68_12191 [Neotoma lepida]|uniref:Uncharacterized protein n=1 Tax=Neotoma lepida TaxID=56216 RepID=A0A1A6H4H6_NEOLE|nr:hypothetical protein A6R68_12191 [Neotoma lepida]
MPPARLAIEVAEVDLATLWVVEETLEVVEIMLVVVETLVEEGAMVVEVAAAEVVVAMEVVMVDIMDLEEMVDTPRSVHRYVSWVLLLISGTKDGTFVPNIVIIEKHLRAPGLQKQSEGEAIKPAKMAALADVTRSHSQVTDVLRRKAFVCQDLVPQYATIESVQAVSESGLHGPGSTLVTRI